MPFTKRLSWSIGELRNNNIVDVNTTVLKKIIKITLSLGVVKLGVLAIVAISTIMTISMHGDILAVATTTSIAYIGDPGYQHTVNVPSYPFSTSTLGISITTANGYTDHANVGVSGATSWTFNIPTNQGSWIQVCVNSDNSSRGSCNTYGTTGTDMSVSLSPPSGILPHVLTKKWNSFLFSVQPIFLTVDL